MSSRREPSVGERVSAWLARPEIIERLVLLRILAPLAALGFMSSRLVHADRWIGSAGFTVPDIGGDYRQPIYIAPLPDVLAWLLAVVMIASGLATALGFRTRQAAAVFAGTLVYVALADRLAAFTVSKISPIVMVALALSAAGSRFGVDAWLSARSEDAPPREPTHAPAGAIRFVQLFLPIFTCAPERLMVSLWTVQPVVSTDAHDTVNSCSGTGPGGGKAVHFFPPVPDPPITHMQE